MVRRSTAALMVALVIAGCQSAPGSQQAQPAQEEAAPSSAVTTERAAPVRPRTRPDLPAPLELDLEQRHPNGVIVRVHRITFDPTFITVELSAVNGFRDEVTLAADPFTGMTLVDDTGVDYKFIAPDVNDNLRVESGGTLEGQVVFTGELAADARTLTLTLNPGRDGADDSTIFPMFRFPDIPIR